mgnify:CR=1 FL=1
MSQPILATTEVTQLPSHCGRARAAWRRDSGLATVDYEGRAREGGRAHRNHAQVNGFNPERRKT